MLSLPEYGYWLQALTEHRRNARLSRAALLELQRRKFRRLVRFAKERSPYYGELIRRLRLNVDTCQPEDFPVLTKRDLIERFDDLVTDRNIRQRDVLEFVQNCRSPYERFRGQYRVVHTTGTTGTRGHMLYSPREWIQTTSLAARIPFPRLRRRVAALLPGLPCFGSVQMTTGFLRGPAGWLVTGKILPIEWDRGRLIEALNEFQPLSLSGYVVHLKLMAEAQASGELRIKPLEITTGGEQLRPHEKAQIEAAFGVQVRNNYACTEGLYLALSQGQGGDDGLYLQEDEVHFEVHPQHVCITPLFNYTLPLIRYRLDDALTLAPQANSPLPFTRVQSVVGRQDWSLVFRDREGKAGVLTYPTIDRLSLPGVAVLQAVQESESSLSLRVQFNSGLVEPDKRQLQARLESMLRDTLQTLRLDSVHSRVCETSDLHRTPTGKVRAIVPYARA